jgi:hypothetical protein
MSQKRDMGRPAQALAAARPNHELHTLLLHATSLHDILYLLGQKKPSGVKDVLITNCKACHETEQKRVREWTTQKFVVSEPPARERFLLAESQHLNGNREFPTAFFQKAAAGVNSNLPIWNYSM